MKLQLFQTKKNSNQVKLIAEILGLTTAISLSSTLKPVQALSLTKGNYDFDTSVDINIFFPENNLFPFDINFQATLTGSSNILIGNPVDAIVDHPLFGNVGSSDSIFDVTPFEIVSLEVTAPNPLDPNLSLVVQTGDGVADFAPTPLETTFPFNSLFAGGAFIDSSNDLSFFQVFLEVEGTVLGKENGSIEPVIFNAVLPLNQIQEGQPLEFISTHETSLYGPGVDGIFWTGDEKVSSLIVPDGDQPALRLTFTPTNTPEPVNVPEPSNLLSFVVLGLTVIFGFNKSKK